MNALYGLLAAPTAGAAVSAVGRAADAARAPFELLLEQAIAAGSSVDAKNGATDETAAFDERVAQQLQQLLMAAGLEPGDAVTLEIDHITGDVTVDGDDSRAQAVEEALHGDPALVDVLRQLVDRDDPQTARHYLRPTRLEVQLGDDDSVSLQPL